MLCIRHVCDKMATGLNFTENFNLHLVDNTIAWADNFGVLQYSYVAQLCLRGVSRPKDIIK